jgi:hypothetical protein
VQLSREREKKVKKGKTSQKATRKRKRNKGLVVFSIKEAFRKEPLLRVDKPPLAPTPDFKSGDSKRDIGAKNEL